MLQIQQIDQSTYTLSGRFDAAQEPIAAPVFENIIESVSFDVSGLDYISSMGLGMLIGLYKRLHDQQHTVTLVNPPKHVRDVLHYTSLEKFFIIL
jgi:anti-anti-sigma factor